MNISRIEEWRERLPSVSSLGSYIEDLIATSVVAPGLMIALTLAAYIAKWSGNEAVLFGVFGGLVGWFLLALLAQHFMTSERANPMVYRELSSRTKILDWQWELALRQRRRYTMEEINEKLYLPRRENLNIATLRAHL